MIGLWINRLGDWLIDWFRSASAWYRAGVAGTWEAGVLEGGRLEGGAPKAGEIGTAGLQVREEVCSQGGISQRDDPGKGFRFSTRSMFSIMLCYLIKSEIGTFVWSIGNI